MADPYRVLEVSPGASAAEIKAAYRRLVKQHHPDAGGDEGRIVALNAAWEVLGDEEARRRYDSSQAAGAGRARAAAAPPPRGRGAAADAALVQWLAQVYAPLDRLLGAVLDPFAGQLQALSADPYDDSLMAGFCAYLEGSRERLDRGEALFRSLPCPASLQAFGLAVYQCLAAVQDAITELERYTLGYVDDYLRDGREMIREAIRQRQRLQAQLPDQPSS